jgi:hypothetical protein
MGSLLPPESHPLLGAVSEVAAMAMTRRLRIDFDGQTLLDVTPWFAMAPGVVMPGPGVEDGRAKGTRILALHRDETALERLRAEGEVEARVALARMAAAGPAVLRVTLPAGRAGQREPLIVAGRPGRGDFVAVEYGDDGTVRFVCDHWGGLLQQSEPVAVDYGRPHEIQIAMNSLRALRWFRTSWSVMRGRLEIWLDGRSVWRVSGEFFVPNPVDIAVGRNPIGGTTCGGGFTGVIHDYQPVAGGAMR